ncbi:hypothetical protein N9C18_01320 [Planktomarina temperata]|nr:hypothetical protein [Planktomarina temperata]
MARRRRSKIGFQPGDEIKIEAPNSIDPPWGSRDPVTKDTAEKPINSVGQIGESILPKFGASVKADQNLDPAALANNSQNVTYSNSGSSTFEDYLASVNIEERTGNYLISVGLPGSGKTVLQSFTTYSMSVAGNLSIKPDNLKNEKREINHQAQHLRTLWLDDWKRGQFPKGTPLRENEIREIRLNVENLENRSQNFNFSFLEIAGENFKDVVPEGSVPILYDRIKRFLTNTKIKLNIAFILKTDEKLGEPTNDALFTNFIDFIEANLKLDLTQKVGLILVVPNPKLVFGQEDWARMRSNRSADRKFYKERLRQYIYDNFPATYTIYDRWNSKKRAITIFHIGDEIDGLLQNKDYKDARSFINLNYNFFTSKNLEPKNSRWKRIFGIK